MSVANPKKERFVFIDGLRALAALLVMFHHLFFSELQGPLESVFPAGVAWVLRHGVFGVQIFFVISGFVIAYSLRWTVVTAASAGNFILRRQLRLDPPYWICIAGTMLHILMQSIIHPIYRPLIPGFREVALNLFYLHDLFHVPRVLVVSWTLCLEVQFYLVYILILFLIQRAVGFFNWQHHRQGAVLMAMMTPLFLLSLWRLSLDANESPYFIRTWYLFSLGVLTCWTIERRIPAAALGLGIGAVMAVCLVRFDERAICGCATAAAIFAVARAGRLTTLLGNRLMQYLGRISYSLYLVHWDIGKAVLRAGMHVSGMARWAAVFWFFIAALACIGVAHLLHILVERPTMNFAARLKSRPATIVLAPEPVLS